MINEYLFISSMFAPLLAVFAVLILPNMNSTLAKSFALIATGFSLIVSIYLWSVMYLSEKLELFKFTTEFLSAYNLPMFGLNEISMIMYALAAIVGFCAVLVGNASKIKNYKLYLSLLLVMQFGLLGTFASVNMLWAYIFHEFALIPTFIATIYWGGAGKRVASMQMAIYLTLGALISLLGLVALYFYVDAPSFDLPILLKSAYAMTDAAPAGYIFILLLIGFSILVSVFPFHSWAPRGYAAAPTAFSMLHAGVLKKFGFYMLIQLVIPILPREALDYLPYLAIFALCNVVLIGLMTMAQRDLKLMLSYSSVSHIGICMLGVATFSVLGVGGAVLFAFGHGLSIAVLFYLANIITNKTNKWDMNEMGGLISRTPVLCAFFLTAILANIGLPGFANFWGELSVLVALWENNFLFCSVAALGIIISAIYGLRAVAKIFFGPSSAEFEKLTDITFKEKIPAIILIVALLFIGFYPRVATRMLNEKLPITLYSLNVQK